jgi:DNA-binding transcriptional LysR family regulator
VAWSFTILLLIAFRFFKRSCSALCTPEFCHHSRTLYASPNYLTKHGIPQHPDDLANHHLIGNNRASSMNLWERQDAKSGLQVKGQTLTDNSAVLLSMVRHGVGIARLLDIVAAPLVRTGELVPLLRPHFDVQEIPIYAVMLQERHRLPKIRTSLEFWSEYLISRA